MDAFKASGGTPSTLGEASPPSPTRNLRETPVQPRPLADRPLTQPHPHRLPPSVPRYDEILRRHNAALQAGEAGYLDPSSGLFVLTAGFLADRGTCCDKGCRHCPYVE